VSHSTCTAVLKNPNTKTVQINTSAFVIMYVMLATLHTFFSERFVISTNPWFGLLIGFYPSK